MNILFVADVFGAPGRRAIESRLPALREELAADFCIVNGENAAAGRGITAKLADKLLASGADVVTLGNWVWGQQDFAPYLDPLVNDLSGPNAHAWSDVNDNDSATLDANHHIVPLDKPDPGEEVARQKGGFDFATFAPATSPSGSCDATHLCSWNHQTQTWNTNRARFVEQARRWGTRRDRSG